MNASELELYYVISLSSLFFSQMPRVKRTRRKTPIVLPETTRTSSSAPQSTRTVIRRFHVLLKKRSQILNTPTADSNSVEALASVQHQISDLGGLKCYQRMSAVGQSGDRGGGSEKVLIRWLKELKVKSLTLKESKVRYVYKVILIIPVIFSRPLGSSMLERSSQIITNRVLRGFSAHRLTCVHAIRQFENRIFFSCLRSTAAHGMS
jgi:hypothetical protein